MARPRKIKCAKYFYPSARVMHISCNVADTRGNVVLTMGKVAEVLKKHEGAYSTCAYILHDKDTYNGEDVCVREEKRKEMYMERYELQAITVGLGEDETQETGRVYNAELARKVQGEVDAIMQEVQAGTPKQPHIHIVLGFSQSRSVLDIANWFGIPSQFVEVKKGRTALPNALKYLVHANDKQKYQYSPDEVVANYDYAADLEKRMLLDAQHEKYHIEIDSIDDLVNEVYYNGLSLKKVIEQLSYAVYSKHIKRFKEARANYLRDNGAMPLYRMVWYIEGKCDAQGKSLGGEGKTLCAQALAKQMAREYGADISKPIEQLDDYIFCVGGNRVALDDYDGQPILFINDIDSTRIINTLGDIREVKELMEPYPRLKRNSHVKFNKTVLIPKYVILNGITSCERFKRELNSYLARDDMREQIKYGASPETLNLDDYVTKEFDRRIWGNIQIIDDEYINIMFNKGLFEGTDEWDTFQALAKVRANFRKLATCNVDRMITTDIEGRVLLPLTDKISEFDKKKRVKQIDNFDDLPDEIKSFGQVYVEPEPEVQQILFEDSEG